MFSPEAAALGLQRIIDDYRGISIAYIKTGTGKLMPDNPNLETVTYWTPEAENFECKAFGSGIAIPDETKLEFLPDKADAGLVGYSGTFSIAPNATPSQLYTIISRNNKGDGTTSNAGRWRNNALTKGKFYQLSGIVPLKAQSSLSDKSPVNLGYGFSFNIPEYVEIYELTYWMISLV